MQCHREVCLGVPMRVVEGERVETGQMLGKKVLAMESTDTREAHL